MIDNTNRFKAILNDCEVNSTSFEGLGNITGVSCTKDGGFIEILPSDTEAGIETFFRKNGDYFVLSYIGDTPDFVFKYDGDDTHQNTIFSISDVDETFGKLFFNPNDDFITGTIQKTVPSYMLKTTNSLVSSDQKPPLKINTIVVHLLSGLISAEENVLDIVSYLNGMAIHLGRSFTDKTVYGSSRKAINIGLKSNSKVVSFSFGNLIVDGGNINDTKDREGITKLSELDGDGFRVISKILDTPNKIYNTKADV